MYLNVGCGPEPFRPPWTNLDHEAWRFQREGCVVVQHDIRKPLPYRDDSVEVINASHVIEHLVVDEAKGFLKEAKRVLVPGGRIRIGVPDAMGIIHRYVHGKMDELAEHIQEEYRAVKSQGLKFAIVFFGAGASDLDTYRGHKACYDHESLREVLRFAGFKDVRPSRYNESEVEILRGIDEHPGVTIWVEGVKSRPSSS